MTKQQLIIISIGAITGGLLLCWFVATSTMEDIVSTTCVVLGLMFAVGGFVSLILAVKKSAVDKKKETIK